MAACATTYFEPGRFETGCVEAGCVKPERVAPERIEAGRGLAARIAERNAELMARQPELRRRMRTPEFPFAHNFDNSRLVKASDPVRARQMQVFAAAVTVLLSLIMVYGIQHFYAIESGYHVESERAVLEHLSEQNRQLRLSEAELTQPARIDQLARQLGMAAPQPGQVVYPNAEPNANGPVLAQNAPPLAKDGF